MLTTPRFSTHARVVSTGIRPAQCVDQTGAAHHLSAHALALAVIGNYCPCLRRAALHLSPPTPKRTTLYIKRRSSVLVYGAPQANRSVFGSTHGSHQNPIQALYFAARRLATLQCESGAPRPRGTSEGYIGRQSEAARPARVIISLSRSVLQNHAQPRPGAQNCEQSVPGGSDCFSLSAFSASVTQSVYKYLLHRTLNFVTVFDFLILTDWASLRRAVNRKSLISLICLGCQPGQRQKKNSNDPRQELSVAPAATYDVAAHGG